MSNENQPTFSQVSASANNTLASNIINKKEESHISDSAAIAQVADLSLEPSCTDLLSSEIEVSESTSNHIDSCEGDLVEKITSSFQLNSSPATPTDLSCIPPYDSPSSAKEADTYTGSSNEGILENTESSQECKYIMKDQTMQEHFILNADKYSTYKLIC